jgi:hypothetical protein
MSEQPVTIIRASALSGYADCPRRSAARMFRQEIEAAGFQLGRTIRGIGAAIGTAVHRGAEIALAEKAHSGRLPPIGVTEDAAIETLRDQIAGEIEYEGPAGVTQTKAQAEIQSRQMTRAYHRAIAPTVDPIQVEQRLEAEIAPGVILSGQADLVAREPGAVRDLKTGARPPRAFAPQLGAYSLLARTHELEIEHAHVDYIKRVTAGRPQPEPKTQRAAIARAETAAAATIGHILRDLHIFRHGDPELRIMPGDVWAFAANPSSSLCSPKFCPAFGTDFCHEGDPSKAVP